jgi:archaemetzincin
VKTLGIGLLLLLAAPREPDVAVPGGFWKPLPPPRPGEWRWRYPERGQTFAEYKDAQPVRPTPPRRTIYLQPFLTRPPRDARELEHVRGLLEAFFGLEVAVLGGRPLPPGVYVRRRRQVDVLRLAKALVRRLPDDAVFLLAVTDRDLFVGDLGYSYGWGSLRLRVGVVSSSRLAGEGDPTLRRRRLLTLAAHEAGHTLSLPHCTFFGCLMNGARTLGEADDRPELLCPVCRAKLCWNIGLEPLARYRALADAYARAGLGEAARRTRVVADLTRKHSKG